MTDFDGTAGNTAGNKQGENVEDESERKAGSTKTDRY